MKRTIACFLACMLLIPGMFVYASAEEDSIFTYDDSKAYVPNVILLTFRYNFDGGDYLTIIGVHEHLEMLRPSSGFKAFGKL